MSIETFANDAAKERLLYLPLFASAPRVRTSWLGRRIRVIEGERGRFPIDCAPQTRLGLA